jgi:SulP family sulfate permease
MRRMVEVSGVRLVGPSHPELARRDLPRGVVVYDVAGPLFFGAAHKAMTTLREMDRRDLHVVVLDLEDVPAIDATALVALEELIRELNAVNVVVVLAGVQGQVLRAFARAGWRGRRSGVRVFRSVARGLDLAARLAARHGHEVAA